MFAPAPVSSDTSAAASNSASVAEPHFHLLLQWGTTRLPMLAARSISVAMFKVQVCQALQLGSCKLPGLRLTGKEEDTPLSDTLPLSAKSSETLECSPACSSARVTKLLVIGSTAADVRRMQVTEQQAQAEHNTATVPTAQEEQAAQIVAQAARDNTLASATVTSSTPPSAEPLVVERHLVVVLLCAMWSTPRVASAARSSAWKPENKRWGPRRQYQQVPCALQLMQAIGIRGRPYTQVMSIDQPSEEHDQDEERKNSQIPANDYDKSDEGVSQKQDFQLLNRASDSMLPENVGPKVIIVWRRAQPPRRLQVENCYPDVIRLINGLQPQRFQMGDDMNMQMIQAYFNQPPQHLPADAADRATRALGASARLFQACADVRAPLTLGSELLVEWADDNDAGLGMMQGPPPDWMYEQSTRYAAGHFGILDDNSD